MARNTRSPESRRQDLVEAASALFKKQGFDATSVEEIAKCAGVAKGTFYLYFSSKDDMLNGIVSHMLHHVFEYIDELIADTEKSALDKMIGINWYLRDLANRNREVTEEFHDKRNELLHMKLERESIRGLVPRYEKLIEQGMAEGVFNVAHAREAAMAILSLAAYAFGDEADLAAVMNNKRERYLAVLDTISRILGASPGLFDEWIKKVEGYDDR
jgi:AcrR family transcriptional regulator